MMKTVFKMQLDGWSDFPDNQLLRCEKQKKKEANILLTIPYGYSYLDIGSHYGDTILTLALFAKKWDRGDIRFFAFEPNKKKCRHIKKIARLNRLNVTVYNYCVGNNSDMVSSDGLWDESLGCCSYIKNVDGDIKTIRLDSIKTQVEPVGIMHIDTEGWESEVLTGASELIYNTIYIIAECWLPEQSINRGFSDDPERDIIAIMKKYDCEQLDDIYDCERNLVFKVK